MVRGVVIYNCSEGTDKNLEVRIMRELNWDAICEEIFGLVKLGTMDEDDAFTEMEIKYGMDLDESDTMVEKYYAFLDEIDGWLMSMGA